MEKLNNLIVIYIQGVNYFEINLKMTLKLILLSSIVVLMYFDISSEESLIPRNNCEYHFVIHIYIAYWLVWVKQSIFLIKNAKIQRVENFSYSLTRYKIRRNSKIPARNFVWILSNWSKSSAYGSWISYSRTQYTCSKYNRGEYKIFAVHEVSWWINYVNA